MMTVTITAEAPTVRYRLLFVQNKSLQKTASELRNNYFTTWTKTRVDDTRWEYLRDHPGAAGYIVENKAVRDPSVAGKVNVSTDEWVRHCPPYMSTLYIDNG